MDKDPGNVVCHCVLSRYLFACFQPVFRLAAWFLDTDQLNGARVIYCVPLATFLLELVIPPTTGWVASVGERFACDRLSRVRFLVCLFFPLSTLSAPVYIIPGRLLLYSDEISARAIIEATYRVCWGPLQIRKDTIMRYRPLIYPRNIHVIPGHMPSE